MNTKKGWRGPDILRSLFCLIMSRGKVIVFWRQIHSAARRAHWTENSKSADYGQAHAADEAV